MILNLCIHTATVDTRVNYSCPFIDVLFESAADVFEDSLVGFVLTGANADGAHELETIKARVGLAIVQDPTTAHAAAIPLAPLLMQIDTTREEAYGAAC